ncbi:hypothetical protein [Solimonas terrae]|uniref:Carboxypeptidase regulatory-like domain-containing protein n=1 Tax=Solimonas terrae TaxID=1396819 RepID=A0A6M2BSB9_9GAMM|nr:hypothetical protein [Solimonas terrae]NGY05111.1 hypothetical protein [Solimonas terrae]
MKFPYEAARSGRLLLIGSLFIVAQLAACGGGGHDDGGDGGTPPPTTVKLKLKGAVTDAPVANAVVTVHVGDQSFAATADANGTYEADVEVDESQTGAFVSIDAKGTDGQEFVEFSSLLGSLATLASQAGGDGVLTPDENFATQVTNVSTAEAALLVRANGGNPVSSEAALKALGAAVNGQAVLDLATAIKLAVDSAAEHPLPSGFSSTLALANDADASDAFVADTQAQNPEMFAQAQASIVDDPTLTKPVVAGDIPASLTAAILSTDAGFTFNYTNRVVTYEFDQSGSGVVAGGSYNVGMHWVASGSGVAVTYNEPIRTVSYDTEDCDGTVRQVEAHYTTNGATLSLLSGRTLASKETATIHYADCPSLADRTQTTTSASTILGDDDFEQLTAGDLADTRQSFYVYDAAQQQVVADVAQLNADGSGIAMVSGEAFSWTVDAQGAVNVSFAGGVVGRYRELRAVDAFTSDLFYDLQTDDGRFVDAGASVEVDPAFATEIDVADLPGRYYQFGIGNELNPGSGTKDFRLRFDPSGTGAQENDFIDGNGNLVTVDENRDPSVAFRWVLDDNMIVVQRTFNTDNGAYNCVAGSANCVLFDQRTIIPLVDENGRYYVLERRQVATYGITAQTPTTGLIRYYDYEPLDAPAAGAAPPARVGKLAPARGPSLH